MRINVNYFLSFLFLVFTGSCQTESDLVTPTLDYQLSSNLTTADFEFGVATAKIDFDKGQNEWKVHRNNPCTKCQCKRCGNKWSGGLPTPSEPHYKLPTRITKDKLRLVLRRIPRNQISVPKKLNKMVKDILEES